ncbi:hypothetical protein Pla163_03250 [Planctomycetes bacterium Pla163]|uniref:Uncharacterized protein n=1 Tax=Rohdeia mirabilis TaxID=2528008 RepID=A0A518CVG4_9BACT|nr:hypothetical protein Pla163_03250 [Planctomycetes bacterium Pla163]
MGKKKDKRTDRKVKSKCCDKPPHKRCKRCPLRLRD